jgi:hypothetical protein
VQSSAVPRPLDAGFQRARRSYSLADAFYILLLFSSSINEARLFIVLACMCGQPVEGKACCGVSRFEFLPE